MRNVWELPRELDPHPPALEGEERASVVEAHGVLDAELAALAGAVPARRRAPAHRPRPPRPRLALAARRDAPQGPAHAVDRGRAARHHPELTFNQSAAQVYAFLEEDDPALLARIGSSPPRAAWSRSAGCGWSPTASCPPGSRWCASSSTGSATSARASAPSTRSAGCPTASASRPPCPSSCSAPASSASSRSSSRGPRPTASRTTCSGGRDWTAHACWPTSSTTRTAATTASSGRRAALATWRKYRGRDIHPESLLSVGYGDGGGGPTREMIERGPRARRLPCRARPALRPRGRVLRPGGPQRGRRGAPTWVGELYLELHRGTLTSQGRTKRAHRRAERDLVAAEVARRARRARRRRPAALARARVAGAAAQRVPRHPPRARASARWPRRPRPSSAG